MPKNSPFKISNGWRATAFRELVNERVDFFEQVTNYCLLGATNRELGAFFGYDANMWLFWMKHSQELRDAVDAGTTLADAEVASALKKRAMGYDYTRQKLVVGKDGHATIHDLSDHVPADTAAAKFWLTNRSKNWSDKQEHEHRGEVAIDQNITIEFVGPRETLNITPTHTQIPDLPTEDQ